MNFFSQQEVIDTTKTFKSMHSFNERSKESARVRLSHPERIPVIVERGNTSVKMIDKRKYLVPKDLTIGQFIYVIRKRLDLSPDQAIFVFINNTLPTTSELMINEYNNKKDDDGFLYITYSGESTFGKN